MTNTPNPTGDKPVVTQAWLRELLRDKVQFYVSGDATEEDIEKLFDSFTDSDEYDQNVAALVQVPRWISQCEAQQAVDDAFRHREQDTLSREGREASILWERNVLATIIVELLNMVPRVRRGAGDMIVRRARQAIDGLPDAIAQGEENYRAYRLALRETEKPDGTLESLATVATMLEEFGVKELPANEQGQVDFMRAIMESAVDEIRGFLANQAALSPPASEGRDVGREALLTDHFPTGLRSEYPRTAGRIGVTGGGVIVDCTCGHRIVGTDEQEARQLWSAHASAALSTAPASPEQPDQADVLRERIAELEAENDRLSKAVGSGILRDLLNDEEQDEFVKFIKFLRSSPEARAALTQTKDTTDDA